MQISPAQVQLTGKGRKTRSVPLMEQTVCILKEYMKRNGLDNGLNGDHPLFFNAQEKKLTRQGITYVLKKYAEQCGINDISTQITLYYYLSPITQIITIISKNFYFLIRNGIFYNNGSLYLMNSFHWAFYNIILFL